MIYLVHTLKQQGEKTINTDFVIETADESDIKEIMNQCKVIVLSTTIVPGRPKSGRFFATIEHEGKILQCCVAADNIEHACQRCTMIDLPIVNIQDKQSPISPEQAQAIIQRYHQERTQELDSERQKLLEGREKK